MAEGRGRLSAMELLPDEAQEDVLWAAAELNARKRHQIDILAELNERLAVKNLGPISLSAFNRKSTKLSAVSRRLDDARYLFTGLADRFTPEAIEQQDVAIGEFLKLLIFELAQDHRATPKAALELARAYVATIQGQRASADRRRKAKADIDAATEKAVTVVAEKRGLDAEARQALLDALRADLG